MEVKPPTLWTKSKDENFIQNRRRDAMKRQGQLKEADGVSSKRKSPFWRRSVDDGEVSARTKGAYEGT